MTYSLRIKLIDELNVLKSILKEAEKEGELNHNLRVKIMNHIGQVKSMLYNDAVFKSLYTATEYRSYKMIIK